MITEIKIDLTTLPKDGQKVKWQTQNEIDDRIWIEGVYDGSEQTFMYKIDKDLDEDTFDAFDMVWDVHHWEPID